MCRLFYLKGAFVCVHVRLPSVWLFLTFLSCPRSFAHEQEVKPSSTRGGSLAYDRFNGLMSPGAASSLKTVGSAQWCHLSLVLLPTSHHSWGERTGVGLHISLITSSELSGHSRVSRARSSSFIIHPRMQLFKTEAEALNLRAGQKWFTLPVYVLVLSSFNEHRGRFHLPSPPDVGLMSIQTNSKINTWRLLSFFSHVSSLLGAAGRLTGNTSKSCLFSSLFGATCNSTASHQCCFTIIHFKDNTRTIR